ncbi:MAG: hypothetical protein JOZ56_07860, partial [Actinobacteria bacterium]|nr:hypothetical protein [Actinomycetota bacterium]
PGRGRGRGPGQGGGGGRPQGGPGQGARPASARPGGRDRARGQDNVEQPRTDENAVSAEGREQPVIEPQVEVTPQEVAQAPEAAPEPKGDQGGEGAES